MLPVINKGVYYKVFGYRGITSKGLGKPNETTFVLGE